MKNWLFKIVSDDSDKPLIEVKWKGETKRLYPEEIIGILLKKFQKDVKQKTSEDVTCVTIVHPRSFTDDQCRALMNAVESANLTCIRLFKPDASAVLAYGLNQDNRSIQKVVIFDLGGRTLDVTLIEIEDGLGETQAFSTNDHLGGEDFTNRMVNYFALRFQEKYGLDIRSSKVALLKLSYECEKAKKKLSTTEEVTIICDSLFEGHDFTDSISREIFENLNIELFQSTLETVEKVLNDGKITKDDVTSLIIIGGSAKIIKVKEIVENFFKRKALTGFEPNEASASEAAHMSAMIVNCYA